MIQLAFRELAALSQGRSPGSLNRNQKQEGHVIDAFVNQSPGGVLGGSPTKPLGKSSLYRGGQREEKIQEGKSEHGDDRQARTRI
jgi:hypothetical protein